MRIHVCRQCGIGVIGQRRCDDCLKRPFPGYSYRTGMGAFLLTVLIMYLGIQEVPENSVVGEQAFQAALFFPPQVSKPKIPDTRFQLMNDSIIGLAE